MGWLLELGLKEGLVECAIVCGKSEVILIFKKQKTSLTFGIVTLVPVWTKTIQNLLTNICTCTTVVLLKISRPDYVVIFLPL
jgi:hypothetical protein